MQKVCKIHGLTEYGPNGNNQFRCKICKRKAVVRWRRNTKLRAIAYLGSSCKLCGYNKCLDAMEFHHRDKTSKSFGISSKGSTRSWEQVKKT